MSLELLDFSLEEELLWSVHSYARLNDGFDGHTDKKNNNNKKMMDILIKK